MKDRGVVVRNSEPNITKVELSRSFPKLEVHRTRLSKGSFVDIYQYHYFPALIHIQLQLEQTNITFVSFLLYLFVSNLITKGAEAHVFPLLTWKRISSISKQDGAFLSLSGREWVCFQPCHTTIPPAVTEGKTPSFCTGKWCGPSRAENSGQ